MAHKEESMKGLMSLYKSHIKELQTQLKGKPSPVNMSYLAIAYGRLRYFCASAESNQSVNEYNNKQPVIYDNEIAYYGLNPQVSPMEYRKAHPQKTKPELSSYDFWNYDNQNVYSLYVSTNPTAKDQIKDPIAYNRLVENSKKELSVHLAFILTYTKLRAPLEQYKKDLSQVSGNIESVRVKEAAKKLKIVEDLLSKLPEPKPLTVAVNESHETLSAQVKNLFAPFSASLNSNIIQLSKIRRDDTWYDGKLLKVLKALAAIVAGIIPGLADALTYAGVFKATGEKVSDDLQKSLAALDKDLSLGTKP